MAGHERPRAHVRGEQSEARGNAEVIDEHGRRLESFDESNGVVGDRLGLPQQVVPARVRLMQQRGHHSGLGRGEERAQIIAALRRWSDAGVAASAHSQLGPKEAITDDSITQARSGRNDDFGPARDDSVSDRAHREIVRGVVRNNDEQHGHGPSSNIGPRCAVGVDQRGGHRVDREMTEREVARPADSAWPVDEPRARPIAVRRPLTERVSVSTPVSPSVT